MEPSHLLASIVSTLALFLCASAVTTQVVLLVAKNERLKDGMLRVTITAGILLPWLALIYLFVDNAS